MASPTLSVIVPVYNVEKYLCECVDSILNQTFANFELILIDDGSTDNCPAICDRYSQLDKRVKVIHKENGGVSSARNAGLDIASGEYVGFVDSDDLIEPDMYQKMLETIMKADADLCFCRVVAADEEGVRKENNRLFGFGDKVLSSVEVIDILAKGGSTYYEVVYNKLYKKELFAKLRFVEGKQHEDAFLVHHIYGSCSRIVFVEDMFYVYRLRANSIMRESFSIKRLDVIDAFIDRTNYCVSHNMQEAAGYALLQLVGKTLESWVCIRPDDNGSKKRIRSKLREIRLLSKKVSLAALPAKERFKLMLALYVTPAYIGKLKIQRVLNK